MRKLIRCIASVQRICEELDTTPDVALDIQEDRATTQINGLAGIWVLESVSGSPEQGLVLVFKDVDA